MKKYDFTRWVLIGMAALIPLIFTWQPLVETMTTRQTLTAMVARNFYYNGFNLFYPELDNNGPGPYLYSVELPLMPFMTAVLYKITGGVHEILGRLLSLLFSIALMFPLYKLTKKYTSETAALFTVLAFAISPMRILYSRTFQPDMLMLFSFVTSLWLFDRWLEKNGWKDYFLSLLLTVVAALTKPHALIIAFPMLYLTYRKYGNKLFLKPSLWLFAILVISPVALWFGKMRHVTISMNLKYNAWGGHVWDSIGMLTNPIFYKNMFHSIAGVALTPVGFVLMLCGIFLIHKSYRGYFFHSWLFGVVFFFIVLAEPNATHHYYQLILVPIAAVFIGVAVEQLLIGIDRNLAPLKTKFLKFAFSVICAILVVYYIRPIFGPPPLYDHVLTAGKAVEEVTGRDDLVVAALSSGPTFLYYCDRKGWEFLINRGHLREIYQEQGADPSGVVLDPVELLESHRKQGASYFASANMSEFNSVPEFASYMKNSYKVVRETPNTSFSKSDDGSENNADHGHRRWAV